MMLYSRILLGAVFHYVVKCLHCGINHIFGRDIASSTFFIALFA